MRRRELQSERELLRSRAKRFAIWKDEGRNRVVHPRREYSMRCTPWQRKSLAMRSDGSSRWVNPFEVATIRRLIDCLISSSTSCAQNRLLRMQRSGPEASRVTFFTVEGFCYGPWRCGQRLQRGRRKHQGSTRVYFRANHRSGGVSRCGLAMKDICVS